LLVKAVTHKPSKTKKFCKLSITLVSEAGLQGVQEHPHNFDLSKIQAKSLKFWEKSPENPGKNGAQRLQKNK